MDAVLCFKNLVPFLPGKQSSLSGGTIEGDSLKEHFHHGSSFDFEALMHSAPTENFSIILLTNNKNSRLFEIRDAIKAILKGEPYKTPKKSVLSLLKNFENTSVEEIIKLYEAAKVAYPNEYDFNDESDFNQIGYALLKKKRFADAVRIFELNVKMFPGSANAYDSLGEAFFNLGDKKSALLNYRKSFELDSKNSGAAQMIERLPKDQ